MELKGLVTVHDNDAYTRYGPIVTTADGLAFFTSRPRTDNGGNALHAEVTVAVCAAPANVRADQLLGDATQGAIQRLDPQVLNGA